MNRPLSLLIVLLLLVFGASSSLYVIKETETAVKLRFGRLVQTDIQPGLHIKMPMADVIRKFDGSAPGSGVNAQPEVIPSRPMRTRQVNLAVLKPMS